MLTLLQLGWIGTLLVGAWLHKQASSRRREPDEKLPASRLVSMWLSVAVAVAGVAALMALASGPGRSAVALGLAILVVANIAYSRISGVFDEESPDFRTSHGYAEVADLGAFLLMLAWVLSQEPLWGPAAV